LGGNRDAQAYKVRHQMPFPDLAFLLSVQGMENPPQLTADHSTQHIAPSLRDKHHVLFTVPLGAGQAQIKGGYPSFFADWFSPSHLGGGF